MRAQARRFHLRDGATCLTAGRGKLRLKQAQGRSADGIAQHSSLKANLLRGTIHRTIVVLLLLSIVAVIRAESSAKIAKADDAYTFTHVFDRAGTPIDRRACEKVSSRLLSCDPLLLDVGCGHCGTNSMFQFLVNYSGQLQPKYSAADGRVFSIGARKEHLLAGLLNFSRSIYRREFPLYALNDARRVPFGVDISPSYGSISALVHHHVPTANILIHVREPVDSLMSRLYLATGEAFHKHVLHMKITGQLLKSQPACTDADAVNAYTQRYPRVLVLEAEKLLILRDEVMGEVFRFLGVPPQRPTLPTVVTCKLSRYHGGTATCHNGSSRVLPATRALIGSWYDTCNAKLAMALHTPLASLFWGGLEPLADAATPHGNAMPRSVTHGNLALR